MITNPKAKPIANQSPRPPRAPIPMLKELGGVWPLLIIKVMIAAPVPKKPGGKFQLVQLLIFSLKGSFIHPPLGSPFLRAIAQYLHSILGSVSSIFSAGKG